MRNNQLIELETDRDVLKSEVLKNCKENTWARLRESSIHGVGVFAVRDIPSGTSIFPETITEFMFIEWDEVADFHPSLIKMIKDFYVTNEKGFWSPPHSLNKIDPSYFLNHNKKNNCIHLENGDIRSCKLILIGTELTLNYESIYESKLAE